MANKRRIVRTKKLPLHRVIDLQGPENTESKEETTKKINVDEGSILLEAQEITTGDRNKAYGHPYDNYVVTARLWSAILGIVISPEQAALCMVLVKVAREAFKPKRDNRVDIAGYANVVDRIHRRRQGLE